MPDTTKERRVDAGAILELAAEVRGLAVNGVHAAGNGWEHTAKRGQP